MVLGLNPTFSFPFLSFFNVPLRIDIYSEHAAPLMAFRAVENQALFNFLNSIQACVIPLPTPLSIFPSIQEKVESVSFKSISKHHI